MRLEDAEGTWNLGIGMIAVVAADAVAGTIERLVTGGIPAWQLGTMSTSARSLDGCEQGAKGVDAGAVRLVGSYAA